MNAPGDPGSREEDRDSLQTTSGYLSQGEDQVYYTVFAPATRMRACAVLAGAFASDRHATYGNWTHWAESLALSGIEVLKFDYRGHGESTGRFEDQSFSDWIEDLELCTRWMRTRRSDVPLLLHGLQLGALLADHVFQRQMGDALLLWSPPRSAHDMLYELLRLRLASDLAEGRGLRTRDDYVAELESDQPVEVDCFRWSGRLWRESVELSLRSGGDGEGPDGLEAADRPRRVVRLDRLPRDGAAVFDPVSWVNLRREDPDLSGPFGESLAWLASVFAPGSEPCAR